MKKVISFFLLVVTILSIGCLPVFANELTVLDMEQYLINQGIPQSYLDSLIEEEIQNLYSDLCDKKICYQGTQIIKGLSESHSPDQIQPLGTIGSDYLTLSLTYISNIEYDSSVKKNRIIETYVYLNYHWTKLPAISRQDPIAINWTHQYSPSKVILSIIKIMAIMIIIIHGRLIMKLRLPPF